MKSIPKKNYFYLILIVVFTIFLLYYLYLWFLEYDSNGENKSVMFNDLQVINVNELNTYLVENKNAIIYVDNGRNRAFDKRFSLLINKYNCVNKILYMFVNDNKFNEINIPSIIKYENGEIVDMYDIRKDRFSIQKLEDYLTSIGVVDGD